ncbi:unnamed protein product, partial [Onchocerca ochengi]
RNARSYGANCFMTGAVLNVQTFESDGFEEDVDWAIFVFISLYAS